MHPGLQNVANRAAYYATLRQTLLAETLEEQVGDHQIAGDLQEGTLQFVGAECTLTARSHLIASVAPGPKSLLWGWAHPQGGGEVAGRVKELGERFGITDLTSPELPFDAGDDIAATTAHLGHLAACVGVEATRLSPYYTVNAGGGTRLVMVLEGIDVPEPSLMQVASRIEPVLTSGIITDHRSAVLGLAEHREGFTVEDQGQQLVLSDETGSVTFSLDDRQRITNASMSLQGAAG